jgi:hypothetical protein
MVRDGLLALWLGDEKGTIMDRSASFYFTPDPHLDKRTIRFLAPKAPGASPPAQLANVFG